MHILLGTIQQEFMQFYGTMATTTQYLRYVDTITKINTRQKC